MARNVTVVNSTSGPVSSSHTPHASVVNNTGISMLSFNNTSSSSSSNNNNHGYTSTFSTTTPTTSTSSTGYTSTFSSSPNPYQQSSAPNPYQQSSAPPVFEEEPPPPSYTSSHTNPLSSNNLQIPFDALLHDVASSSLGMDQRDIVVRAVQANQVAPLSCEQVLALLEPVVINSYKKDIIIALYPLITDKQNFERILLERGIPSLYHNDVKRNI